IATDYSRMAKHLAFLRRAQLNMRARWTIAAWPTDHWAGQVYPKLKPLTAKRRLAGDLLRFCRLTDEDGKGTSGWTKHLRTLDRRSARLTKLGLARLELRGPGTELDVGFVTGTRWLGGPETLVDGQTVASNMPTEEVFTSPDPRATSGTFRCTFPLSFRGRLIHGLRGEFSSGRLVRLEADSDDDRDFVAAYIDTDRTGRRLGEVALVDSSSRIGQTGRIYNNTLLDEDAGVGSRASEVQALGEAAPPDRPVEAGDRAHAPAGAAAEDRAPARAAQTGAAAEPVPALRRSAARGRSRPAHPQGEERRRA